MTSDDNPTFGFLATFRHLGGQAPYLLAYRLILANDVRKIGKIDKIVTFEKENRLNLFV